VVRRGWQHVLQFSHFLCSEPEIWIFEGKETSQTINNFPLCPQKWFIFWKLFCNFGSWPNVFMKDTFFQRVWISNYTSSNIIAAYFGYAKPWFYPTWRNKWRQTYVFNTSKDAPLKNCFYNVLRVVVTSVFRASIVLTRKFHPL